MKQILILVLSLLSVNVVYARCENMPVRTLEEKFVVVKNDSLSLKCSFKSDSGYIPIEDPIAANGCKLSVKSGEWDAIKGGSLLKTIYVKGNKCKVKAGEAILLKIISANMLCCQLSGSKYCS